MHFGDGETVECDLMLVSVGRAPLVDGIGLEEAGVTFDRRRIGTDDHRRTNVPHIYAAGDVAGYWQLAHTGFREGEVAAENAMGHDATIGEPAVPRPIYTDPEIAGVGLTEAQAREQHGDDVVVGRCPWVAIARAVMSGDTTGWVKSIHESDLRRAARRRHRRAARDRPDREAVVALDAESTIETVADGIAPHPTLAEAIKEAGLVALGRAIHLPPQAPVEVGSGMRSSRNALSGRSAWWFLRRADRQRSARGRRSGPRRHGDAAVAAAIRAVARWASLLVGARRGRRLVALAQAWAASASRAPTGASPAAARPADDVARSDASRRATRPRSRRP